LQANPATAHSRHFADCKVQASDRRRYADMGMTAVIAKPFSPLELAGQVAEALAGAGKK